MGSTHRSLSSRSKIAISVLVAVAVFTASLVVLGVTVPKVKNLIVYKSHDAVSLTSNSSFTSSEGVVRGAGTANDPYIIEGWDIDTSNGSAMEISNTKAFLVIRNCTFAGTGLSARHDGIVIRSAMNVSIENLTLLGFRTGIVVDGTTVAPSGNIGVSKVAVANCENGMVARNTTGLLVEHMFLYQIGLTVENCSSVDILDNNIFQSSAMGIALVDSSDLNVRENVVDTWDTWTYNSNQNVEALRCRNISIANNSLGSESTSLANISGCTNVSVNNNTVRGNVQMSIDHSETCLVADNNLTDVSYSGIRIVSTSKAVVVRNTLLRSGYGIIARSLNDSRVEENVILDCAGTYGGLFLEGTNTRIARNLVMANPDGIALSGSNITFEGNYVRSNGGYLGWPYGGMSCLRVAGIVIDNNSFSMDNPGVFITSCSNVSIQHNNISDDIILSSDDNVTVWGNSMYDVTVPDYYSNGLVSWNLRYPTGGNYWSNYTGVDLKSGPNQNMPGSDGIGDAPYLVNRTASDNYPLTSPLSALDVMPPLTELSVMGNAGYRGWFKSSVNLTFSAFDVHSGVASTHYRIDEGTWTTFSSRVEISSEGVHSLEYYSTDGAGNIERTRTATIKIDTVAPHSAMTDHTSLSFNNTKNFTLQYEFVDNTSGLAYFWISAAYAYYSSGLGPSTVPFAQLTLANGDQQYSVYGFDEAGNGNPILVTIHDSLNEDRQPLSLTGPFGAWYIVGVFVDALLLLGLAGYLAHVHSLTRYAPAGPPEKRFGPGDLDKEELINGYPKLLKKM